MIEQSATSVTKAIN